MKIFLNLILFFQSFYLFGNYSKFYDPEKFQRVEGRFQEKEGRYEGEFYVTFLYSDDDNEPLAVFHVLQRFVPLVNEKILEAKRAGAYLERTSKKTIYYNDENKILRKFRMGPVNPRTSLKKIKSGFDEKFSEQHVQIFDEVVKKDIFGRETHKYFLKLPASSAKDEIQEDLYAYLKRLKERAQYAGRLINFSHGKFFVYTRGYRFPCNELADLAPRENKVTLVPVAAPAFEEKRKQTRPPHSQIQASAPVFPVAPEHKLPSENPSYTASLAAKAVKVPVS